MGVSIRFYNAALPTLLAGDLSGARACLVSSAYTFDAAHAAYTDIAAAELPSGSGYAAGGAALENVAVAGAANGGTITTDGCTWTALTATFRYAILMDAQQRLLWCVTLDDTPADITITASNFTLALPDRVLLRATIAQSAT